ncbi:MAG: UDP-N-acetylglucosamine 1-carboxyvinyltransferase, partial [Rhodothermales bacterium]|nr:UDP-N-acetylglucosamine 1-carboxyvinyltransferase [Rhodothermales bacterium]
MDKLVIRGGQKLRGSLEVSGSKNTALPLMAAAVVAQGRSTIDNVPSLRDINTFSRVIGVTGAVVEWDASAHGLLIDASTITRPEAPYELVKRMRASFYMLGALLARTGQARVSLPGGCAWGPRPVDLHIEGMKAFGAEIDLDEGYVVARATGGRLRGGRFTLTPSSVGATVNLLLAASTASGSSRIENAACEPDIIVFGEALKEMGARIHGLGTRTIEVEGVDGLTAAGLHNCPDRIELGTYMIAAAIS